MPLTGMGGGMNPMTNYGGNSNTQYDNSGGNHGGNQEVQMEER